LPEKEDSRRELRLELARRLHDGAAQQMVALGYKLDEVIGAPDLSPSNRKLIREARLDLIELAQGLRDELYLLERISLDEAVTEVQKILPNSLVEVSLPKKSLEPEIENVLALILLEIARNTARHSNSKKFWIEHQLIEHAEVFRIGNDGTGPIDIKSSSLGLKLISEQARLIGATIELNTGDGIFEYTITLNSSHS